MDTDAYLRFALALVLVVGLIALLAWLVRRFGLAQRLAPGSGTPRRFRRLGVVEVCAVDGRRRLILIKRDGIEHLIMLSGTGGGFVVERGIGAATSTKRRFSNVLADTQQDEDDETSDDGDQTDTPKAAPGAGYSGPSS